MFSTKTLIKEAVMISRHHTLDSIKIQMKYTRVTRVQIKIWIATDISSTIELQPMQLEYCLG